MYYKLSLFIFILEKVTGGFLGSLRCHFKSFSLAYVGWAASQVFSGASRLGDAAGAHLPVAPYCLHFLALVQAGSTWWKRSCCVYFFRIYPCFKCEGKDICIAKWDLASLCEGTLKFSPCNPTSSLQLGPRGIASMEVYNTLIAHSLDLCCISSTASFFPKFSPKSRVHMLGYTARRMRSLHKIGLWFSETTPCHSVCPLLKLISCTRIALVDSQQCLSPCPPWHLGLPSQKHGFPLRPHFVWDPSSELLPSWVALGVLRLF